MASIDPPQATTRSDEGLKSLVKVVRVLDVFSRTARALSLAEICQRTGYPRSTTHRLLSSMREAGLLDQDRNRDRYRLGLKLYELGNIVLANMDLHREARPYVEALGRLTGQVVHLAVFDGRHAVVIGKSESQIDATSGAFLESAPAHCTSVGKAILAYHRYHYHRSRRIAAGTGVDAQPRLLDRSGRASARPELRGRSNP
jgi:DNA-binding IclR family transcriptional regulator